MNIQLMTAIEVGRSFIEPAVAQSSHRFADVRDGVNSFEFLATAFFAKPTVAQCNEALAPGPVPSEVRPVWTVAREGAVARSRSCIIG